MSSSLLTRWTAATSWLDDSNVLTPSVCVPKHFALSIDKLTAALDDAPVGSPALIVVTSDNIPYFIRAARSARGNAVVVLEPSIDAPGGALTESAIERLADAATAANGGRWWILFVEAEKLARPATILSANALMRLAESRASLTTGSGTIVGLEKAAVLIIHRGAINGAVGLPPLKRLREGWSKVYLERGGLPEGATQRAMNMDALFGRIGGDVIEATQSGNNKEWATASNSNDCLLARSMSSLYSIPQAITGLAVFCLLFLSFLLLRKCRRPQAVPTKKIQKLLTRDSEITIALPSPQINTATATTTATATATATSTTTTIKLTANKNVYPLLASRAKSVSSHAVSNAGVTTSGKETAAAIPLLHAAVRSKSGARKRN